MRGVGGGGEVVLAEAEDVATANWTMARVAGGDWGETCSHPQSCFWDDAHAASPVDGRCMRRVCCALPAGE